MDLPSAQGSAIGATSSTQASAEQVSEKKNAGSTQTQL